MRMLVLVVSELVLARSLPCGVPSAERKLESRKVGGVGRRRGAGTSVIYGAGWLAPGARVPVWTMVAPFVLRHRQF
eukprot:jgi/Mesen1/5994/ME000304S05009